MDPPQHQNSHKSPPSSPLSDLASLCSSSPLSELSKSPSPPPQSSRRDPHIRYPTPQSSLQSGSSSPKMLESSDETLRPVKRRRITPPKPRGPKDRGTRKLDLSQIDSDKSQSDLFDWLHHSLRYKKKIVVVAGAGISVSAGIPDFRSSKGLFASQGKNLFDASVYNNNADTTKFHDMIRQLADMASKAKPTPFHHMLASLAAEGRLLRLYTQNIDGLDSSMNPLTTTVPLREKGPWPKTIQLHGGLDKMECQKCKLVQDLVPRLFHGPEAPLCPHCDELDRVRDAVGKRTQGVGRLRPRVLLYNESNSDANAVGNVAHADIRSRPDAVIVVGTTLQIPGVKRIVKQLCVAAKTRRDGITAWINPYTDPPAGEFKDSFDLIVKGTSDDVASLIALPQWDHVDKTTNLAELTDDERKSIERKLSRNNVEIHLSPRKSREPEDLPHKEPGGDQLRAAAPENKAKKSNSHGILTPGASPKLQANPGPGEPRKPKQSKLSFCANQDGKQFVAAKGSGKETKRRGRPKKAGQDIKPQINSLTNTFKSTKALSAAAGKGKTDANNVSDPPIKRDSSLASLPPLRPSKNRQSNQLPPSTPRSNVKDSSTRGVSLEAPGSNDTFYTAKSTPDDRVIEPGHLRRLSKETVSPPTAPRGMGHLLN